MSGKYQQLLKDKGKKVANEYMRSLSLRANKSKGGFASMDKATADKARLKAARSTIKNLEEKATNN